MTFGCLLTVLGVVLMCCDCCLQVSQQFDQNVARDPQRLLKVGLQPDAAVRHLATGFVSQSVSCCRQLPQSLNGRLQTRRRAISLKTVLSSGTFPAGLFHSGGSH